MSNLVVIAFQDEQTAFEMRAALAKMQKEYLIEMEDVVVVTKGDDGKVKLHQAQNLTALVAASGGFWGMLIGMIFLNDIEVMNDPNVRKAAAHAIDKQAIIDRLLSGYGVKIDTLQTPEYDAYDPSVTVPYDEAKAIELLAASGYSRDNPVRFKIQTTRGFKPKDFEMIQAIVGLWRRVGIEAEIEVYEIAKHFELRAADQLAPAAFYNWGNSVGDPTTSTGFAMFGPSPHSVWDGEDLIGMIGPLWGEQDEAKRIEGWKAVDRYIAENALVIPLLQYVQPILHAPGVVVTPHASGALLPHLMKRA